MTKTALLKATTKSLHALEQGLIGYVQTNHGPCHLILADGTSVVVFVIGTDVAPRFECFSLALDFDIAPAGPVTAFATSKGGTTVSILVREEYDEPFTGDPSSLVGTGPTTTQTAAKPGHVPDHALSSCLVAYGLLVEGAKGRLAIVADWSPFQIEVTADEARIATHLRVSEAMTIDRYSALYGLS